MWYSEKNKKGIDWKTRSAHAAEVEGKNKTKPLPGSEETYGKPLKAYKKE